METTTTATTTVPEAAAPNYAVYFRIWIVLLAITLAMVFIDNRAFLVLGMSAKAILIALWYMHLKDERKDFIFYIAGSIIIFSLVLFGLIAPDGLARLPT